MKERVLLLWDPNVRILPAVAYGGLSIEIDSEPVVSQPNALGGGGTFEGEISDVDASETEGEFYNCRRGNNR